MRITLACILLLAVATTANTQERIAVSKSCSYDGSGLPDQLWAFGSDKDAESAVERIMQYVGAPKSFEVKAANVDNAAAAFEDGRPVILYNQSFMLKVADNTKTDWAAVSILAHEIGHHISFHTLDKDGSRPETELQADKFSGHILYRMGADLDEAQAAMKAVASASGSKTHPPKSARLAAIANGWTQARDQNPREPEKTVTDEPDPEGGGASKPNSPLTKMPEMEPPPYGPEVIGRAVFVDNTVTFLLSNGEVKTLYMGLEIVVAYQQQSADPRFAWLYVTATDPSVEYYLNMMGMTGQTTYGVDLNGAIWGSDMFNNLVQVGQVYYE